ncbi:MAG: hypothetical protein SCH71_10625 [Desulfobulbaceae bacterium]|nr:hypothetical protein [Desulfobulbaceae bacterium]
MKTPDDLWEDIGTLTDEELSHVIAALYRTYEERLKRNPKDEEALNFFRNLYNSIHQSTL